MQEAPSRSFPTMDPKIDVVRRHAFERWRLVSARWCFAWVVPYQVAVLLLIFVRGAPTRAVAMQAIAATVVGVALAWRTVRPASSQSAWGVVAIGVAILGTLVQVAATGGVASPMLLGLFPLLGSAALQPMDAKTRAGLFTFVVLAFVGVLLLAGSLGPSLPAFQFRSEGLSLDYLAVAMLGAVVAAGSARELGESVTCVYERVSRELAQRREQICSETEDRTKALEGIAARLAHEVKNPLAAIKGLSSHMARQASDEKTAERLGIVASEADRLQAIVDEFLSFSRGLGELNIAPIHPAEVARELTVLLETRATEAQVQLEVKGGPELVLNADGRKLRQALLNLVLNALQASRPGGIVSIEVASSCTAGASIRVIDRGAGMSPEILERIKRPYYTTREGGTGLGIAIARGIVEQHGGTLAFESSPGKGTTVTLSMPACSRSIANAQKLPNPVREVTPA